ncbi:MAG: T9SS type A sorting domain-containing protein, partial [Ferruginibacter sp.]|nr:T9SS type A sorting domain-containing protein [Ferruginibacter sp.]
NPCNIQTPEFISTGATMVGLTFDIIVLDANLKCYSWKNYACETSIDVFYYVAGIRYTGIIDQPLPPNGPGNPTSVSLSFNPGNNLPVGTAYKIEMCFKPKSGVGNCIQQNTKYVFDNFRNCETSSRAITPNERSASNGHTQQNMPMNVASAQTVQNCLTENFSGQTAGWTYSQGAHVGNYPNPVAGCVDDRGIITPGVGGNNPCNIQTPEFISTGATMVGLTFDIIVLDANLKCYSWKNYACETSIDVFYYVAGIRYTGIIDQPLPPNGPGNPTSVSLSFNPGNNLPLGTAYKIEMCFKPKSGVGNCIQQNTKYVFDNFRNCETSSRPITPNERPGSNGNTQQNIPMDHFTLSPNPTNGSSKITATADSETKSISLLDYNGKVIQSVTGTSFIVFNINGLAKGKYYVQFEKENGDQLRKRVTVN